MIVVHPTIKFCKIDILSLQASLFNAYNTWCTWYLNFLNVFRGKMPKPEMFEGTTVFFCDIVSFTKIAGKSLQFLGIIYNM